MSNDVKTTQDQDFEAMMEHPGKLQRPGPGRRQRHQ